MLNLLKSNPSTLVGVLTEKRNDGCSGKVVGNVGDNTNIGAKGGVVKLVEDGEIKRDNMRPHNVIENELMEALHSKAGPEDLSKVKSACLERSGNISVVKRKED